MTVAYVKPDLHAFLQTADRAALEAAIERVEVQLVEARKRCGEHAIDYASTPDGAAEMFRRFELAPNEIERKNLKTIYLAGLALANQEFEERRELGNAGPADGPLEVIPTGSFVEPVDPIVRALVEHRIMGTYRSTARAFETERVQVSLLRLLPDGQTRRRLRIQVPAPNGIFTETLAEVITTAWNNTKIRPRLIAFLEETATPVTAAIAARSHS